MDVHVPSYRYVYGRLAEIPDIVICESGDLHDVDRTVVVRSGVALTTLWAHLRDRRSATRRNVHL
jgi:hypothetical protein